MADFNNTVVNDDGFIKIPVGTTAERPNPPEAGDFRYNTDNNSLEYYDGSSWKEV